MSYKTIRSPTSFSKTHQSCSASFSEIVAYTRVYTLVRSSHYIRFKPVYPNKNTISGEWYIIFAHINSNPTIFWFNDYILK